MYQVAPEETDDNEGTKMAVIWDFQPTTGMTGAAIQPEEKPADHMVSVPRLAFDEVSCNCTQFPSVGDIVRTPDTGAIAARLQNLNLSSVPDVHGDSDDENDKESGEEDARDKSNRKVEESCRPVNPILHWFSLLDRPRPRQWYITYTELITLSNTLYNAETSIFAKKYPTYGPQNRAVNEEQHYTNAGDSLLAKLLQYLLKILHFSLYKKHNSCWAHKDLRCKHTNGQSIKSQ